MPNQPKQSKEKDRDALLSDILNNLQLQSTLLHDQQTEMINQLPASKRSQINALQRRIIESQLEVRDMIVRFNREFVNAPDIVIPIHFSDSSPPSSLRNSIRVVKQNKGKVSAAVVTIAVAIVVAILKRYGIDL